MQRGSDDAVLSAVAEPHRARRRDGRIGLALNQHHVGGGMLTEAWTRVTSDKGGRTSRATILANLKPPICGRRRARETARPRRAGYRSLEHEEATWQPDT